MTGQTTGQAIERADTSPKAMVKQYQDSFAQVLPSHITRPETWIRIAQGALKKGKRLPSGETELEVAAKNNPGVFLASLLDAARLGLEPGTEQYYLTPRPVKGGGTEILGIVGYQGMVELMYRAGAVSSVVAEVVYEKDSFHFRPGIDPVPVHEIDWDADDRGELRLVYAFARMKDGATSKVVVLNRQAIASVKRKAQSPDGQYSPWKNQPEAMWLKSAVRQLAKWVPTSSEYRDRVAQQGPSGAPSPQPDLGAPDLPAVDEGRTDDDVIDAELVHDDEPFDQEPPPYEPGGEPFE